jgi:hypothetical protein
MESAFMKTNVVTIAACVLLAVAGCGKDEAASEEAVAPKNEPTARDAAPGPLSEATPPSTSQDESAGDKPAEVEPR